MGWTRDGQSLVFASDRADRVHAYTVAVARGAPRGEPKMVTAMGQISPMGFARDGSYYYGLQLPGENIYTATVDFEIGHVLQQPVRAFQLHEGSQSAPDWSRDGKSLACRTWVSRGCLVRSTETGDIKELRPKLSRKFNASFHSLRWSPDGNSFLFAGLDSLLRVDSHSGNVKEILQAPRIFDADWSHDGKTVFYVDRPQPNESYRIIRHELESGMDQVLSHIAQRVLWLTVSPDGQRLALLTKKIFESDEGLLQLMPTTGGEPEELIRVKGITHGGLSWSADGRWLIYGRGGEQSTRLWRVAASGGTPQELELSVSGRMRHLRVHPDGKQIAFNLSTSKSELWVMENLLSSLEAERYSTPSPR